MYAIRSYYATPISPIDSLKDEFRHHLETFYAQLKLAPPYESVEKAIRSLVTSVHALPSAERALLATTSDLRWELFRRAFEVSGLNKNRITSYNVCYTKLLRHSRNHYLTKKQQRVNHP